MSSLLQHTGSIIDGKVELFCYQVSKGKDWEKYNGSDAYDPNPNSTVFTDPVELTNDNPRLYRFWRKPRGMFGQWVVFRYNREDHVPDLSVPIPLFELPKDAERMSDEDCEVYWKS